MPFFDRPPPPFPPPPTHTHSQFDDPKSRNLRTRSAPGDPAPIVPASPGAAGYGADLSVVQVRVGVVVERLSLYYSLTALVPIVLCVVIALMTHVIDPDLVETRLVREGGRGGRGEARRKQDATYQAPPPPPLCFSTQQIVVTLFLSLTALQLVFEVRSARVCWERGGDKNDPSAKSQPPPHLAPPPLPFFPQGDLPKSSYILPTGQLGECRWQRGARRG